MRTSVDELAPLIGVAAACDALGVPRSSFYYAKQPTPSPRLARPRPRPPQALSYENSERFVDCAPHTIYATLLDEGVLHCSWRTMYRILKRDAATRERRNLRRRRVYAAPELLATGPRQVWSWDITKLRGPTAGIWYHLYVILDIFSRKIVGWRAEAREDARLAEELVAGAFAREGIEPHQLTLHADRGAAMTSKTVSDLLDDLGIAKSHSRPTISDDNPYSESQFKTMKYGPTYPDRFASLDEARAWMRPFVAWYNHHHRHSGIAFLTPDVVHRGQAQVVLAQRQAMLDAAYARHPERYPRGRPQVAALPAQVGINLPRPLLTEASAPPDDGVGADQTALGASTSPTGAVAPPSDQSTEVVVTPPPS